MPKFIFRPHQVEGIAWLAERESGVIASEMGLGKTSMSTKNMQDRPVIVDGKTLPNLIVCPTALSTQWSKELPKVHTDAESFIYDGDKTVRREKLGTLLAAEKPPTHVIMSYSILRNDIEFILKHKWGHVVLDEAHTIKNGFGSKAAAVALAAHRLRECSKHRWALSGTPVNNNLMDLASIAVFLGVAPYNDKKWWKRELTTNEKKSDGELKFRADLLQYNEDFVLVQRKTPEMLKPVASQTIYVPALTGEGEVVKMLREATKEAFEKWKSARGYAKIEMQGELLALITRLRQTSCAHYMYSDELPTAEQLYDQCAKIKAVVDRIIETFETSFDHRVLVFSNYPKFMEMVSKCVDAKRPGLMKSLFYTGSTKKQERVANVTDFQSKCPANRVMFVTLAAGGCGLNLMAARTVIVSDPWFNPFLEDQAIARAHRIGQERDVHVFRFIMENSIETWIQKLHDKKRMVAGVAGLIEAKSLPKDFSMKDLKELFIDTVSTGGELAIEQRKAKLTERELKMAKKAEVAAERKAERAEKKKIAAERKAERAEKKKIAAEAKAKAVAVSKAKPSEKALKAKAKRAQRQAERKAKAKAVIDARAERNRIIEIKKCVSM